MYLSVNGFVVLSKGKLVSGDWFNTSTAYHCRCLPNRLSRLLPRDIQLSRKERPAFEDKTRDGVWMCWLFTDAGDSPWIGERRCGQKVYHAHTKTRTDFRRCLSRKMSGNQAASVSIAGNVSV